MTDLTRSGLPGSPDKILVCAYCRGAIHDDLEHGMLYWDVPDDPTGNTRQPVAKVELAHKRCRNDAERRHSPLRGLLDYSAELWWLAAPELALRRLSSMADGYAFSGEQLQRIIDIAWAVAVVGGVEHAKEAREMHERFGL